MNTADEPCIILFASVDLIGSTAYKNSVSSGMGEIGPRKQRWYDAFGLFYSVFSRDLNNELALKSEIIDQDRRRFLFLKGLGDELIFYQQIVNHREAVAFTQAFRSTLRSFNGELNSRFPLGVKGALWIAGFPINNAQIETPVQHGNGTAGVDFLGPSIDTGFRLSKFSDRRRLVVSVDLALLLTADDRREDGLTFYFDGTHQLKGVLNEKPYPVIWIACEDQTSEELLVGVDKRECHPPHLRQYCEDYISKASKDSWLNKPYFKEGADPLFDEMPQRHKETLKQNQKEDLKSREIGVDPAPTELTQLSADDMLAASSILPVIRDASPTMPSESPTPTEG